MERAWEIGLGSSLLLFFCTIQLQAAREPAWAAPQWEEDLPSLILLCWENKNVWHFGTENAFCLVPLPDRTNLLQTTVLCSLGEAPRHRWGRREHLCSAWLGNSGASLEHWPEFQPQVGQWCQRSLQALQVELRAWRKMALNCCHSPLPLRWDVSHTSTSNGGLVLLHLLSHKQCCKFLVGLLRSTFTGSVLSAS